MKKYLLLLAMLFFFSITQTSAQGGTWVWMNGSNASFGVAVFGTQGVAAPANTPGAVYEPVSWIDLQGNFWIFGGMFWSDLWKYNPVTNMWTWVKGPGVSNDPGSYGVPGVPSPTNNPDARGYGCISWTDNNGDLWLWGGDGTAGYLNDLWRYNIASNEWTWMNGSQLGYPTSVFGTFQVEAAGNTPSGRRETTCGWVDNSNNLWMFGGWENNVGMYDNDMWRYNISTNQWAWMNGPQITGNTGSYGTMGVEMAANLPPSRGAFTHWKDAAGNLYMFGGAGAAGSFSDVWKYNLATNNWTWVAGDNTPNSLGNYTSICGTPATTGPMSRFENIASQIAGCTNQFLTFGGSHDPYPFNSVSCMNDLWMFNATANQWKWLSGTNISNDPGNRGVLGVPAPTNLPSARSGNAQWVDNNGNFWIFAGWTNGSTYNDIWKFIPDTTCVQLNIAVGPGNLSYQLSDTAVCSGDSVLLILSGVSSAQITPSTNLHWVDSTHIYLFPPTTTTYTITGQTLCRSADTASFTLHPSNPAVSIVADTTQICPSDSAHICATAGFTSYTWSSGQSVSCIAVNSTGNYIVTATDNLGCTAVSNQIPITAIPGPTVNLGNDTSVCLPDTLTLNATYPGAFYVWSNGSTSSTILAYQTNTYHVTVSVGSCVATDSIHVIENPKPPASVTANQTTFCDGDSAQICATAGMISYLWNTGETSSCIVTQLAGNYYVTLTDANGCSAASNHLAIAVYPSPPVSISVNGDTLSSYNAVTYQWFLNGNIIPGATQQTYIATQGGSYTVEVTDTNGCPATSTAVIISGISPLSLGEGQGVRIFPNPNASNTWNLEVAPELLGSQVEIFDAEGRLVLKSNIEHRISSIELNVEGGIYLMRFVSEKRIVTEKLIKL